MKTSITEIICAIVGAVGCILICVLCAAFVEASSHINMASPVDFAVTIIFWLGIVAVFALCWALNNPDEM